MKEIVINTNQFIEPSTKLEKEIAYNEIFKKINIDINQYHIDNFIDNDQYMFEDKVQFEKSSIISITIKKLLVYLTPIIDDYPSKTINKTGITIKSNYNIHSFVKKNNMLIPFRIPIHTNFTLIGFMFPQKIFVNQLPYSLNNFKELITSDDFSKFYNDIKIENNLLKHENTYFLIKNNEEKLYDELLDIIKYYHDLYKNNNLFSIINKEHSKENIFNLTNYINSITKYNETKYLDIFNKYIPIKINNYYSDSTYTTLKNLAFLDIYNYIKLYGEDNEYVSIKLKEIQNKFNKLQEINLNQISLIQNKLKLNKYELICKKIFPNLFNITHKDNLFNKSVPFNINLLSKKYKDIILIEYTKYVNFINSYYLNKCEHKSFLQSFNINPNNETFDNLKPYINLSKKDKIFTCKKCSFDILCPHKYELYSQLLALNDDPEDKEYSIRQYIIRKYMANTPINFTYYCKYCSEEIGKSIDAEQYVKFNGDRKINSNVVDELQKKIYVMISYILTNYVQINNLIIKKKQLINIVLDQIIDPINTISINLYKAKTNSEEVIDYTLSINITIYIFATILTLATQYKEINIITNKIKIGGLVKTKQNIDQLKNNFKNAFDDIIQYQAYNINSIKLQHKSIQNLLLEYYRNVAKQNVYIQMDASVKQINILDFIMADPIYNYIYYINRIYNKKIKFDDIAYLLNKKPENFLTIYNTKKIDKELINDLYTNIYDKIKIPFNIKLEIKSDEDYIKLSYYQFYYYLVNGLYFYSPFSSNYPKEILDKIDIYQNITDKIVEFDKIKIDQNRLYYMIPYLYFPSNSDRLFKYHINNLNLYYCLSGIKHSFKTYIYQDSKKKTQIYQKKQLDSIVYNKDLVFIDKQCNNCMYYLSDINKQSKTTISENNTTINNKIQFNDEIILFFNKYKIHCPVGINQIHIFIKNQCKNCGVSKEELDNNDIKYYKKYKNNYDDYIKNKKNNLFITNKEYPTILIDNILKNLKIKDSKEDIQKNNIDLSRIISDKFKLKQYQLQYLGIFEGLKIEEVEELYKNNNLDDLIKQNISNRTIKLNNYIQSLYIYYNLIRKAYNIGQLNEVELYLIIQKIKKDINPNIINKLPSLQYDINQYKTYYSFKYSDTELNNYLLNIILKNILFLINSTINTKMEPIIFDFLNFYLKKITYQDELFSKFEYKLLKFNTPKGSFDEDEDENYVPEVDVEEEVDEEDNLFSYDNFDLNVDADELDDGGDGIDSFD